MTIGNRTAVSLGVRLALALAITEATAPTTEGTAVRTMFLSTGFMITFRWVIAF